MRDPSPNSSFTSLKILFALSISSSLIASSTISIQISSLVLFLLLFCFKSDSQILHAPQYKSNIFPSKFQSILNAVQNSFSAHNVLV